MTSMEEKTMTAVFLFLIFIVLNIIIATSVLWINTYSSIMKYRKLLEETWAEMDTQFKRRYHLIPDFIEIANEYVTTKQNTFEKMKEMSTQLSQGEIKKREELVQYNNELTSSLQDIFALSKHHSNLQSNERFKLLQKELIAIEKNILSAKQLYNTTVMKHNIKVETFPFNLIASIHQFFKEDMLEMNEEKYKDSTESIKP